MKKINKIIEWVKNYDSWAKKDYIKAGIIVVIVLAVIISIFSYFQMQMEILEKQQNLQDMLQHLIQELYKD
jgi:uncharacterized protein YpmB